MSSFNEYTLQNGMRVILAPKEGTQAMTALVFVTVGSRYEPDAVAGISHFLEHMCFKGTQKRPSAKIIAKTLDAIGAEYNAYTGKEYTGYYIKADARHTELALDMLSDIYYHSLFDNEEIEREKGPVCQEIKMYEDNPLRSIYDWFEQTLFDRHTLGRDIAGSIESVQRLTRDDVVMWHTKHYHAANTTIVLAGCLDKKAQDMVGRFFDAKRVGSAQEHVPFDVTKNQKPLLTLKKKKTDQVQVMMGFPAYPHHDPRVPALVLLQTILGGGMSSRLFSEVRERRGLAYLVRAGVEEFKDTGSFYVHVGVDGEKLPELFNVVLDELHKCTAEPVSSTELQEAKDQWYGRLVLASEDSSWNAEWYAQQVFLKQRETPDDVWKRVRAVSAADIQEVARDVMQWDRFRIAIIGPKLDTTSLEEHVRKHITSFN